jgi:uncharacterized Fe-S cluster-containing MiaB family protein
VTTRHVGKQTVWKHIRNHNLRLWIDEEFEEAVSTVIINTDGTFGDYEEIPKETLFKYYEKVNLKNPMQSLTEMANE